MNPLVMRIIALFDTEETDEVNFKQFITTLSAFHPKASVQERLRVAFRIYDMDNDGVISQRDLSQTLVLMAGNNLTQSQLNIIAEETVKAATRDGSSAITLQHFEEVLVLVCLS